MTHLRANLVVHAEPVFRVVSALDLDEAVIVLAVSRTNALLALIGLRVMRVNRPPILAGPSPEFAGLRRIVIYPGDDH